jgi:uncharacterized protein (TIGR00297 family)
MLSTINSLNPWLVAVGLNTVLLAIVWFAPKKLLTPAGVFHAWILGVLIWGTLGWQGYLVVMFYFLVGSGVTRIGMEQKEAAGIAEKRSGARGTGECLGFGANWGNLRLGNASSSPACALTVVRLRGKFGDEAF